MEYFFDKLNIHRIYFVGIGGISMSALAKLCHNSGYKVTGADRKESEITTELRNLGMKVYIGHNAQNLQDADTVVYTSAVGDCNPEVLEAKKRNLLVFERVEFLQLICQKYKNVIAIAGTHGKTTTTGMIGCIFISANKNPTIHIGGECEQFGGNLRVGGKEFFITEACEYQKHLLKIPHDVGVVLNIEKDHPDTFSSLEDLHNTFDKFCVMSKSLNVLNEKDLLLLSNHDKYGFVTFSSDGSGTFTARRIRQFQNGKIKFDCYKNGVFFASIVLNLFGKHNVLNALASIAVADYYGISKLSIIEGLKNFGGVKRRFQFVGEVCGNIVIEDYAHHPTEISAVLETCKQVFKHKQIVAVFQPHTYSRTKALFNEFLTCFECCDKILVLPTYSAREKPMKNSSGKFLADKLKQKNKPCEYVRSFAGAYKRIKRVKNCVVVLVGAGDIENLAVKIRSEYIKKCEK